MLATGTSATGPAAASDALNTPAYLDSRIQLDVIRCACRRCNETLAERTRYETIVVDGWYCYRHSRGLADGSTRGRPSDSGLSRNGSGIRIGCDGTTVR